ncbi:hypothetical protein DVR12_21140 [Chitinophaga silvatica]|uniref:Thioredoxin domain-containing protein n=1 Tax=Chitinophaga silvatica TaxID=2282649 RepID=A0A3E1Y696_9BACT|nr:TlpA disulfide reductase family protein [Chitinophaga silvatica]RFS20222.1 hypothetical protein DVR12_21140 [Chitinophaga silvatica]
MLLLKMKLTCAILLCLWSLAASAQSGQPILEAGAIGISGEVTIPANIKKDSVWLYLKIPQPFTGEVRTYKTLLDSNGRFILKVNTETNLSRCVISTNIAIDKKVTVLLKNGQESKIFFNYNNDGVINKVKVSDNHGLTEEEIIQSLSKFSELINYRSNKPVEPLYNKDYSAFIDNTNDVLQGKRIVLNKPPLLSEKMNEILVKDYALAVYYNHVFDYHNEMVLNYRNTNNRWMPDSVVIKKPVREDYSFLKNMDLNNQLYLYCFSYPIFTQQLLQNNILSIPRIQDTPIDEWTESVKGIFGHLFGFDQGMFYDMLVGNAYAMQFETELKPLTIKQIENIKSYYKGGDLEKILLRRNQEVTELAGLKETVVINSTPNVSPEELMNAIISRYKGKTVVVDFWATWCAPCLGAIKESRAFKKQLSDKGTVFIYISNSSSPKGLWERHIQGIGGQQYYLTTKEWKYLLERFNFGAIPSYLIFDKNGILKQQFLEYPGNEVMKKRIEAILEGDPV